MNKLLVIMITFAFSATTQAQTQVPNTFQAGQPARAAEVNENFDTLESAIDQNSASIAAVEDDVADLIEVNTERGEGALDAIGRLQRKKDGAEVQLMNLNNALRNIGVELALCDSQKPYACESATNDSGLKLTVVRYSPRYQQIIVRNPAGTNGNVSAYPYDGNGFDQLVFGGAANFTRVQAAGGRPVLVDSCTSPTIQLVPQNDVATSRLGLDNGLVYSGIIGESVQATVDVTGQTYGRINPYVRDEPMCELVSDAVGLYDVYSLVLREDTSTWTTGGNSTVWTLSTTP